MTRVAAVHAGLIVALFAGAFVGPLKGQSREAIEVAPAPLASPSTRRPSTPQFRGSVDLVPLDVCVRDANGRFLPDLSADDFLVLENGKPQQVSFLLPADELPLNAVLLIDMSHSMYGPKLNRALEAARQFAGWLDPGDRLEIITFNHRAMRLHGFDDDPVQVQGTLTSAMGTALASIGSTGSTALYDALLIATNDLVRRRQTAVPETRDVIIVLSDGEDTSSRIGFEEVLPAVRRSGVLVYTVSLRASERGEWLGANWSMLQLARDTGARALGVPQLEALPDLYREINTEVRHLYRLAYVSNETRRDGQWRTISVRVPSRDVRVSTRAGYYAPRDPTRHPSEASPGLWNAR